ncbi:MAG: hypothetical protein PHR78_02970 [Eubacteriales bacterium]|nr:hypothetical protein [Eubacteriales bacterium]MDD4324668.1 hypothetical protein [Eubacteriales bacterium]MDD4541116.1 hypothetical protein [Eubacteriales bacterium]
MNEQNYPTPAEEKSNVENMEDLLPSEDSKITDTKTEADTDRFVIPEEKATETKTVFQTNPQAPPRYQSTASNMYRQPPRGQDNNRVYYQQQVTPAYENQNETEIRTRSRSMPGTIGFGFAASLLSLFLIPFFHDFFPIFLNAYSDPITYDRETYLMYFVLVLIYGGVSAMLAVFGLIFAPLGMNRSKRFDLEGRALGSATILISIVSLILLVVSIVSSLLIHEML